MTTYQNLRNGLAERIQKLNITDTEAARRMNISNSTIRPIIDGTYELKPNTKIFNAVQAFVFADKAEVMWQRANTPIYIGIARTAEACRANGESRAISDQAGIGKSFALEDIARNNAYTFYVECVGDMTKSELLKALCKAMGVRDSSKLSEMRDDIINRLNILKQSKDTRPLLLIDEFDELKDGAMRVFKDIYNKCPGVGMLLCGGINFQKRIERGVRNAKQSYKEIYSRVGGTFITPTTARDKGLDWYAMVEAIAEANGVTDSNAIREWSIKINGDLRRLVALINTYKYAKPQAHSN